MEPAPETAMPRDAEAIRGIFKAMGVDKYEPSTVAQLLEFQYRYVKGILEESQIYAMHDQNREDITLEDVRLATQSRVNFSFTQPPPREFLLQLATAKNQEPLEELSVRPPLGAEWNRVLPRLGDEWLSATSYQVGYEKARPKKGKDKGKERSEAETEADGDVEMADAGPASAAAAAPSTGQSAAGAGMWGESAPRLSGLSGGRGGGRGGGGGGGGGGVRPTPPGPRRGASFGGGLTVKLPTNGAAAGRGTRKKGDDIEWEQ